MVEPIKPRRAGGLEEAPAEYGVPTVSDMPAGSAIPRHMEIATTLEKEIAEGVYPVSGMLPTETELCLRFGVSRHTILAALGRLNEIGLVQRKAGTGTVVIADKPATAFVHRVGTLRGLLAYPEHTYRELLSVDWLTTDQQLGTTIGCEVGREWFRMSCLRKSDADPTPFCWGEFYLPLSVGSAFDWPKIDRRTVHDRIRELGHHQAYRAEIQISATAITGSMADVLHVREGAPGLHIVRRYFDEPGNNFTTTRTIHPEHRFVYTMDLTRDE